MVKKLTLSRLSSAYAEGHQAGFLNQVVKNPYAKQKGKRVKEWLGGYAEGQAKRNELQVAS